jgi:ferredoxin
VTEYLELETEGDPETIPYLLMVDESNVLQRVVVDDKLVHSARRCRERWRSLQELGGINNSHANKLLEAERLRWEQESARVVEEMQRVAQVAPSEAVSEPVEVTATETAAEVETAPAAEEETAAAPPSDEPYIETPRCTTCDECTQINNRMFAYDDNKQAYIADLDAGTFRELVEAAESCQVAIIHPGKPRNPDEPNLEELIQRAEAFA